MYSEDVRKRNGHALRGEDSHGRELNPPRKARKKDAGSRQHRHDGARPTIKEIATHAGVSTGTVSRVLSGRAQVAEDLAERVSTVARELGYQTRRPARRAKSEDGASLGSIGYLIDAVERSNLNTPFFQHYLTGISNEVARRGGHVVFANCREDVANGTMPFMVANRIVDAVIVKASHHTPDEWLKKINRIVPAVLLMHWCADRSLPSVSCDNDGAVRQLMAHLRGLGHTRIAFLGLREPQASSLHNFDRQWAYSRYVDLMGCVAHPDYIQMPVFDPIDLDQMARLRQALRNLLALGPEAPTAILCAADVYALPLLQIARSEGLSVPRDLSVAGIMNTDACEHSLPTLTSVDIHQEELGRMTVETLQLRLESRHSTAHHLALSTNLVERKSCGPPRSHPLP